MNHLQSEPRNETTHVWGAEGGAYRQGVFSSTLMSKIITYTYYLIRPTPAEWSHNHILYPDRRTHSNHDHLTVSERWLITEGSFSQSVLNCTY